MKNTTKISFLFLIMGLFSSKASMAALSQEAIDNFASDIIKSYHNAMNVKLMFATGQTVSDAMLTDLYSEQQSIIALLSKLEDTEAYQLVNLRVNGVPLILDPAVFDQPLLLQTFLQHRAEIMDPIPKLNKYGCSRSSTIADNLIYLISQLPPELRDKYYSDVLKTIKLKKRKARFNFSSCTIS